MLITLPKMEHIKDPADDIRESVGDLKKIRALPVGRILVGTYVRPEKTAGGIYIDPSIRREDLYQGKVGLVLKLGPKSFENTATLDFGGFSVKEGDWVVYMPKNSEALSINGHHCRMIEDKFIDAVVEGPDVIL